MRGRFPTAVWTIAAALMLAACTTTTPPPPPPTTTTATTVPASSTTGPTRPVSATSTTTTSTTSTEPPATDTFLTVGNTCALGWWDGDWQSGDDLPVGGGERYQVVRLVETIGVATGSEPRPFCQPLDLISVELDPPLPGSFLELDALAIQTGKNVRPYPVELLGTASRAYVAAAAELLEGRVARVRVVNLTQVIRTDLEGDGIDEVIVAASTIPGDLISAQVGDYSIVFLRKLIEGEVQTAVLGESIVDDLDNLLQDLVIFEVSAVADLNGDGTMEIVLNGTVWEGAFLQAFEYVDDDLGPVEVLACGCGS